MKILVTGGDGMLANAIRNIYPDFESDIFFCNRSALDITDLGKTIEYFNKGNFDVIINCAAYTNVEGAETNIESAYAINENGAMNIAIAANKINARLIHISTDAVYDGNKNDVYYEDDICNPLSVYSKSKYAGEIEILKHHDTGIIIRTSWLYSLDKPNFVTAIINKARTVGACNLIYNQLGTPTYTYDLAKAILQIIKSKKIVPGSGIEIYHYSNEGAISWYDFAINICSILSIDVSITPITTDQYPSKVKRPFHAIMSKTKIKNIFGLEIPYWRDSLKLCLSSYDKTKKISLKNDKNG